MRPATRFFAVILALFATLKDVGCIFGSYDFAFPTMTYPRTPSVFQPPSPMMGWNPRRHADWGPPGPHPFNPHAEWTSSSEEEDDDAFDNSSCPGGWSGGVRWPCQPVKSCTSLRPRGFRAYCGWEGGQPLVCCPPKDKESIHAESSNVQNRLKPKNGPQKCGLLVTDDKSSASLRVGAPEALIGGVPLRTAQSSPWMVAIGEKSKSGTDWYCGGALIAERWAVTAAHCLLRRRADLVRVGELDFSREDEEASPKDMAVANTIIHPDYKPPVFYHDIALVQLKEAAPFSKFVQPVCLPAPTKRNLEGAIAVLSGWGDTEFGGERSEVLREVSVPIIPNERCTASYSSRTIAQRNYPQGITSNLLCAGDLVNGGKDACQGDSGAPLVMREGNVHSLVGIVSSGVGCGSRNYPGVYVRVSSYTEWIKKVWK